MDAMRLTLLEAIGVDVYVLRGRASTVLSAPDNERRTGDEAGQVRPQLAVVCARGVRGDPRLARLFKHLPQTLGVSAGAIGWLEAGAGGELAGAEDAPAYLVLGSAMARALGVQLSTMQQNTAIIAVSADPVQLPGSAADKRALWQTLKPIARRLRGTTG